MLTLCLGGMQVAIGAPNGVIIIGQTVLTHELMCTQDAVAPQTIISNGRYHLSLVLGVHS